MLLSPIYGLPKGEDVRLPSDLWLLMEQAWPHNSWGPVQNEDVAPLF